jgi:hypothetical protein
LLNFQRLINQIEAVGSDGAEKLESIANLLAAATVAFDEAASQPQSFADRLLENAELVLWPLSKPIEPIGLKIPIAEIKAPGTVLAVDGSQIMPSQHEVHSCFLLNIGLVRIAYGTTEQPILESFPRLYHRREELYPLVNRRRMHIDELYVSLERNLLELEFICKNACDAKSLGLPVVAFVDGSLIPWSAEKMPDVYQEHYFRKALGWLNELKENQVPVIGYLSHSRSSDVINTLRVLKCPYDVSDCRTHCRDLNEEDFPCSTIWPLPDRLLFKKVLPVHTRSNLFMSQASATRSLGENQKVCFCYLNVGTEIARLEFPYWLVKEKDLFNQAMATVIDQVEKGHGYPLALAEAHHLAVIRGADRQQFFEMLTRHLVSRGVMETKLSPKESKKRIGLV